ncbi:MAG TPA: hypothetical protein PLL38_03485 [Anaerolineales bacterium]|nr:hypothetical protein [Anaerolineales bacterium]
MKTRELLWILLLAALTTLGLDLVTNAINTQGNAWDFLYYIALAKDGFHADPLASPFAYRYLTPFIVHGISLLGFSIERGFGIIAYFGVIMQLTGIFFFVKWLGNSTKGAYLAMAVTALSLFNVKFLLFDIYRPDHLAYALILLQTYLAFNRKFLPLLLTTLIASQIREFNIIPMVAYLFMSFRTTERGLFIKQAAISTICLVPAILLPRLLIPVTENYQLVGLSGDALLTTVILPFIPSVDVNFIFSIFAYLLPLLFLADLKTIKAAFASLPENQRGYVLAYTLLVLLLSFFGGTDFNRFATFLFLPQIILIGLITPAISSLQISLMLAVTFIFNRLWMHIPDWDVEKYRDFYGGFSLRLNMSTLNRIMELAAFWALGFGVRKWQGTTQTLESQRHENTTPQRK